MHQTRSHSQPLVEVSPRNILSQILYKSNTAIFNFDDILTILFVVVLLVLNIVFVETITVFLCDICVVFIVAFAKALANQS